MRIRTLLSISHSLVIIVFILAFLLAFFTLTKPPGPPPGRHSVEAVARLLSQEPDSITLEKELEKIGFRDAVALDIYDADHRQFRLFGPPERVDLPLFGDGLRRQGDLLEEHGPPGRHLSWFSVDLSGPHSHLVRIEEQRSRDKFFSQVRRNIQLASGFALLVGLSLAIPLSRKLAEPIRQLADLVDRFGREGYELRSNVSGNEEIQELGESFNRMAEYIESNTNELREQKEKAEKTEALRRQFLSDVSHNLRTPLAAILGWNDALVEGVADDEGLYRTRIRREVLHVTKTVQRLLELSRWERAEPILLKADISLSELLLEVAENLQEAAEQNGVTLSFEGLSPFLTIHADRQKARDVLQILLENVVEHAGANTHVTIKVEPSADRLQVCLEDNGRGLPETFQAEQDLERGASEVGRACLGLAIASRLVRAHGGSLVLGSREGGGTRCLFSFPRGADLSE